LAAFFTGFVMVGFTDFEVIESRNRGQGLVKSELRRRTTVTETRPEG
jgi:hypothetical protein